jgi:hypothetical protein
LLARSGEFIAKAVVEAGGGVYCLPERARRAAKGGRGMNFSKLSYFEKVATVAAVVVVITGLISLSRDWGILMALSLLAGLGVLAVVFLPQMSATTSLPGSKGSLLVALGAVSTIVILVTAISQINWISNYPLHWDTLQFTLGLVAAVAMTWSGWQILKAEGGKFQIGTSRPMAPAGPTMTPAEPTPPGPEPTAPTSEPTTPPSEPTPPAPPA